MVCISSSAGLPEPTNNSSRKIAFIYATTLIASIGIGFFAGATYSNHYSGNASRSSKETSMPRGLNTKDDGSKDGGSDAVQLRLSEGDDCKMVSQISNSVNNPADWILLISQVLVVRTDLGMSTGKIAAQYVYIS